MLLLFGPIALLKVKYFIISVNRNDINFHHKNVFNKIVHTDTFNYSEIKSISIRKGFLSKLVLFSFSNGRNITLKSFLLGSDKRFKINDFTINYLMEKIYSQE